MKAGVYRISLLSAKIPLVEYNINTTNNTFTYYNAAMGSSPPITITVPVGVYDALTLATALAAAINLNFGTTLNTATVTYNSTTLKYTIANTQATSQYFFTGAISKVIGFTPGTYGPAASITSNSIVDMSVVDYLYIKIIGFSSPSCGLVSTQDNAITYIVPTLGNIGTVLYYTANSGFYQTIKNNEPVRGITVELRTSGGRLYDLQGLNWSMILGFEYLCP